MPKASVKPGYKTTEFWLSLVVIIGNALMASGALGESIEPVVAMIVSALVSVGYGVSRGMVKK